MREAGARWSCALYPLVTVGLLAACASGRELRGTSDPGTGSASGRNVREGGPTCRGPRVAGVWAPRGFCVTEFAGQLDRPRGIAVGGDGRVFVGTREGVAVLHDRNGDGHITGDEKVIVGTRDLSTHGVAISPDGRFLYYAGDRVVRRLALQADGAIESGPGASVITAMPGAVSHPYKSLTFDPQGRLLVGVGSLDNTSTGAGARIVRFEIPASLGANGLAFGAGTAIATNIRNPLALAWDRSGTLWALSPSRDFLYPENTPADFYLDAPGDQVFRVDVTAPHAYGFPQCWSLGMRPYGARSAPGTAFADNEHTHGPHAPALSEGHDDAWCRDPANVVQPVAVLPAHVAPLGALVYTGTRFPQQFRDNLYVALHGSWDRHGEQVGRAIVRLVMDAQGRVTSTEPFVGEAGEHGDMREGVWRTRPVALAQGPDGAMFVTSDDNGQVLRVGYGDE